MSFVDEADLVPPDEVALALVDPAPSRAELLGSVAIVPRWGGNYLRWDRLEDMAAFGIPRREIERRTLDPRTRVKWEDPSSPPKQ